MIVQRVITVDIDTCPACHGIVLDKGESEAIDTLGIAQLMEATDPGLSDTSTPRTGDARCYECDKPMMALVGAGDVEYDWCDGCERLFFDRGELAALDAFKPE